MHCPTASPHSCPPWRFVSLSHSFYLASKKVFCGQQQGVIFTAGMGKCIKIHCLSAAAQPMNRPCLPSLERWRTVTKTKPFSEVPIQAGGNWGLCQDAWGVSRSNDFAGSLGRNSEGRFYFSTSYECRVWVQRVPGCGNGGNPDKKTLREPSIKARCLLFLLTRSINYDSSFPAPQCKVVGLPTAALWIIFAHGEEHVHASNLTSHTSASQ